MDGENSRIWSLFESWLESEDGVRAINEQGGDTRMGNSMLNVCSYSLAGEAFVAGFRLGCRERDDSGVVPDVLKDCTVIDGSLPRAEVPDMIVNAPGNSSTSTLRDIEVGREP